MSTSLYTPLDASRREIRLLRVSPSRSKTDMVRCALFTASLDDKPKYWALSYVWGNAAITTPIYVDDRLFSATVNLEAALRHIRGTGVRELIIWVDAVCINQADLDERSSQVALMGAIYSGADLVEAWVGEDED
ncbi:heterokaryon incompatibility protein-domain-containing protein, partial [Bombardia bombarda]